ncbi:MAG: uracil phosphoribosyltransferase [Prochlorococcaceae cyanobacterium]
MAMTLRVVVPPHPLIGHWLTVLRDPSTPGPLYGSATTELGRWLTYEALRDWLPHRFVSIGTDLGPCQGQVVDATVPILAIPLCPDGLGVWDGAKTVLPTARVLHLHRGESLADAGIDPRCGVLVFAAEVGDAGELESLLASLREQGVTGPRLRVITALVASDGLKRLGESFPDLTLYTACIDPELSADGRISPGIGAVAQRLFGCPSMELEVPAA